MSDLSKLTDAEIDRIAATEVMEWTFTAKGPSGSEQWRKSNEFGGTSYVMRTTGWHPCTDRNQSRLVVKAALAKGGLYIDDHLCVVVGNDELFWITATPRQEVEAAILAVRSLSIGEASSGPERPEDIVSAGETDNANNDSPLLLGHSSDVRREDA